MLILHSSDHVHQAFATVAGDSLLSWQRYLTSPVHVKGAPHCCAQNMVHWKHDSASTAGMAEKHAHGLQPSKVHWWPGHLAAE